MRSELRQLLPLLLLLVAPPPAAVATLAAAAAAAEMLFPLESMSIFAACFGSFEIENVLVANYARRTAASVPTSVPLSPSLSQPTLLHPFSWCTLLATPHLTPPSVFSSRRLLTTIKNLADIATVCNCAAAAVAVASATRLSSASPRRRASFGGTCCILYGVFQLPAPTPSRAVGFKLHLRFAAFLLLRPIPCKCWQQWVYLLGRCIKYNYIHLATEHAPLSVYRALLLKLNSIYFSLIYHL